MIDTIKVKLDRTPRKVVPDGWEVVLISKHPSESQLNQAEKRFTMLRHRKTGLRVGCPGDCAFFAEAELPRLIGKPDGCLLKTQAELDQAIENFLLIAGEVCEITPGKPLVATRIDLCAQVPILTKVLIRLYRNYKLTHIHAFPVCRPSKGLCWTGKPRNACLYDKQLEMKKGPGLLTRVEWQLKIDGTIAEWGGEPIFQELVIEDCYAIFRRLTSDFQPKRDLPPVNQARFVAMGLLEEWEFEGIPFAEIIQSSYHPKSYGRLMRQAAVVAKTLRGEPVDLGKFFPENFEEYRALDVICPWKSTLQQSKQKGINPPK